MIGLIARREIVTRGRTRAYWLITGLLFVAVLAGFFAFDRALPDDARREVTIGVVDAGADYAGVLAQGDAAIDAEVSTVTGATAADELESGDVDVVFDGATMTWASRPSMEITAYVTAKVQAAEINRRLEAAGLTPAEQKELFQPVELGETSLEPSDGSESLSLTVASATSVILFVMLQMWGSFMTTAVVEEKSSRVVEVLLSLVRPLSLLWGKLLGMGALALIQLTAILAAMAIGLTWIVDVDVPSGLWTLLPVAAATFVLGFGFYVSLFALSGATVSRQEDTMIAQVPMLILLMAAYFIGFGVAASPDSALADITTYLPFTSPIVLPVRVAVTDLSSGQILTSLGLLVAGTAVSMSLAAYVYRALLLRTGTRVGWGEVLGLFRPSAG